MSTAFDNLAVDPPVTISKFGTRDDRRYVDDQIRSIASHVLDALLLGKVCTWLEVDGAGGPISAPMCVAAKGKGSDGGITIVPAKSTDAPFIVGIALTSALAGSKVLVMLRGVLSEVISGILNSDTAGFAICNTTTSLPAYASSLGGSDIVLGRVNADGTLILNINVPTSL